MKSKKILGLLLAFSLGFSLLPGKAYAKGVQVGGANNQRIDYVRADYDTIIKKLIEEGIIDKNASPEEAMKIAMELYANYQEPVEKLSLKEKAQREKITSKMKEYGIKKEKDELKSIKKGKNLELPQMVQAEKFEKMVYVAKPLVILMDFNDYKFGDMSKENLEYKFDNYDKDYFQKMLFNDETFKGPNGEEFITMKQYYLQQSGGSYTVDGNVSGWHTAQHDAKFYGKQLSKQKKDSEARTFVKEALVAAAADPNINLADYDKEDRYDIDKDGNFNEPDGIIDHIIVIHAGVGQEQGGGTLGNDAMWSHRSKLDINNDFEFKDLSGKVWKANDYTLQPQSGAVGVFAHEYGHDLGLPDEYDTANSICGEPVGSWSIMSGGSWAGKIGGTMPTGFSPWAKEFLQTSMPDKNWLKGATIDFNNIPEEGYTLLLDEASTKGVNNDVVRINLPNYNETMVEVIEGEKLGYSTKGNNLDTNMTINVDLTGKQDTKLKFKTAYDIEELWDWASVSVRVHGTAEWTVIPGNITTTKNDPQAVITVNHGITGNSKGWVDAEFDLSTYAGKNIDIMFRYQTDPGLDLNGWFIDELKVLSGQDVVYSENFEVNPVAEFDGFEVGNGLEAFEHYYLVEWRNHSNADEGLKFAQGDIEYEPGMLIWYVNNDKYNEENHVGDHPGECFLGVVDADQQIDPYMVYGKTYWYGSSSNRIHDAAFGLDETKAVNIYQFGTDYVTYTDNETFMNPYFSDYKDYTNSQGYIYGPNKGDYKYAEAGLNLKKYGLKIYVTGQSKDKSVGRIHIMRDKK